MNLNLMLAIFEEHKQRTSHNVFENRYCWIYNCNVCMYLDACKREMDKEEEEAYLKEQILNVPL